MKALKNEDLEVVTGGVSTSASNDQEGETKDAYCPKCKTIRTFRLYSGARAVCKKCGEKITL